MTKFIYLLLHYYEGILSTYCFLISFFAHSLQCTLNIIFNIKIQTSSDSDFEWYLPIVTPLWIDIIYLCYLPSIWFKTVLYVLLFFVCFLVFRSFGHFYLFIRSSRFQFICSSGFGLLDQLARFQNWFNFWEVVFFLYCKEEYRNP